MSDAKYVCTMDDMDWLLYTDGRLVGSHVNNQGPTCEFLVGNPPPENTSLRVLFTRVCEKATRRNLLRPIPVHGVIWDGYLKEADTVLVARTQEKHLVKKFLPERKGDTEESYALDDGVLYWRHELKKV